VCHHIPGHNEGEGSNSDHIDGQPIDSQLQNDVLNSRPENIINTEEMVEDVSEELPLTIPDTPVKPELRGYYGGYGGYGGGYGCYGGYYGK